MQNSDASAAKSSLVRQIYFPVIEHIDVDGYVLYPGKEDSVGLSHEFNAGVNVILGINGIGKTTLLLLLYRMLTGDRDLREGEELGGAQRKLTKSDNSVFAVRVPDRAASATATLRFRLRDRTITITRSLKDLSLVSVVPDEAGAALPVHTELEDTYKAIVANLAGLDDFFDWVLLLKYLVFYLEDRRSLVWDKWAQTEVFRILFLPDSTQANYKGLLNTALSADSQARNIQSVLTGEQKKLARLERESAQASPEDLRLLRAEVDGLVYRSERVETQLASYEVERIQCRDNAARLRSDAEKLSQKERELRETLLASIFPKLSDYGAFAIASIEALRGCIVCGSVDAAHLEVARKRIHEKLHCPLCDADPLEQEQTAASGDVAADSHELDDLIQRSASIKAAAVKAEAEENAAVKNYSKVQAEKYEIERDLRASRQKLEVVERAAGIVTSGGVNNSRERLQVLQESVDDYKMEKNDALGQLRVLIEEISANVADFKDRLIEDFQRIIAHFLAEKCELTFRTAARNIGQSSSPVALLFPEFHVLMTSGVFRETGTPREDTGSVSESQKEFIELAFRMAVLSASSGKHACTLIIETPEANLDAVFIPKAGAALNDFALKREGERSTIIASSNLNGSQMIPALLGLLDSHGASTNLETDVSMNVLNLLDFAAKSAALREFSAEYQTQFDKAMAGI